MFEVTTERGLVEDRVLYNSQSYSILDVFLGSLEPSDICINFPDAEITYTADLSKSFLN
ncbi:uncharacterized protein OCT59_006979 [Rhizophagus irregularis]|uniref:uncharacterized protein n=1 Tax=Rhizophagus irregularis TaxID=588596 RepID=UPI00331F14D2|nr:hypothetical protein OCT59_006979 [Rhizophagus irregularis]